MLEALADAIHSIAAHIHTAEVGKAGTKNIFGEDQLALDVLADQIIREKLTSTRLVSQVISEELDEVHIIGDGPYTVCYDPLDGSSLVDVNLSVGTIFGIYATQNLIGRTPREMVAAGFGVYGPRTTLVLSRGEGTHEYRLFPDDEWRLSKSHLKIGEGKMFSPGNLRASYDRPDYLELVNWWMKEGYTLRYSGGMVPDLNQILIKGKGIFSYPGYSHAPRGKLRLLFECAPMAYLVEQAGGAASNGKQPILDQLIESFDQCTPIYIGSVDEVLRCEKMLNQ
ncbi:MAG: sedoheptulose-1,7-bisphosphatase, chloroplastic-like protein [Candidatus Peregrinibacteria bacterium GW2011_GWA2_44_7]|nr:MAG: sedoheptulose-1,7-bisphosphatase, chloroplastic-like protein [Candidatus Peregrinibacteria bacterium GW2011_GWA2_44_7]